MNDRMGLLANRLMAAWFALWSLARIESLGWTGSGWDWSFVGRDFRIYRAAGAAILNGTDPWAASAAWNGVEWHYAAPPTAAQLFAPFALIPESAGLLAFLALSAGLAFLALRRLGLPTWWLLFPPVSEGLLAANPQVALFGLLVVGASSGVPASIGRAIAVGLKSYAIGPVLARREWRAVAACLVGLAVSVALGPNLWARYVGEAGRISARLVQEAQGGVSAAIVLKPGVFGTLLPDGDLGVIAPWLILGVVAGLVAVVAIRDVAAAGWIAIPLLLPAAEYHLATLAIPAARRWSTWILAIPSPPTYLIGLLVLCWEVAADRPALAGTGPAVPLHDWLRSAPGTVVEPAPAIDLGSGRAV